MIQLNLLPDIKKELIKAQRLRNLTVSICIIATIGAGGVLVILGGTLGGQAIQKNMLSNRIRDNFNTILDEKENNNLDNYLTIQNQLTHLDAIRERQVVYSRVFDFLAQINPAPPNNIRLSSLQIGGPMGGGGNPNTVTISGTTASFATLDNFRNVLITARMRYSKGSDGDVQRENLFASVLVSEASLSQSHNDDEGAVSFTIIVDFNPMALNVNVDMENIILDVAGEVDADTPIFRAGEQQ